MDNYDICGFYVETDFWILIELIYCSDHWSLGVYVIHNYYDWKVSIKTYG